MCVCGASASEGFRHCDSFMCHVVYGCLPPPLRGSGPHRPFECGRRLVVVLGVVFVLVVTFVLWILPRKRLIDEQQRIPVDEVSSRRCVLKACRAVNRLALPVQKTSPFKIGLVVMAIITIGGTLASCLASCTLHLAPVLVAKPVESKWHLPTR